MFRTTQSGGENESWNASSQSDICNASAPCRTALRRHLKPVSRTAYCGHGPAGRKSL